MLRRGLKILCLAAVIAYPARHVLAIGLVLASHGRIFLKSTESSGFTQTTFAAKYSERAFNAIRLDETTGTVTMKLGRPLFVNEQKSDKDEQHEIWQYSLDGPRDTHHYVRAIVFNGAGRVVGKERDFYID